MTTKKRNEKTAERAIDQVDEIEKINTEVADYCISVVIPYSKEFAQGKELLMALRSWQKNARFGIKLVVIGDSEEWFSEDITFIPHERVSDNAQIDTAEKLRIAVESPEVTDEFIWTNDDIYLVNPISFAHIVLPKALGDLNAEKYKGLYADNMRQTIMLLDKMRKPKLNYDTHTPFAFEKKKLRQIFTLFPEIFSGVLIASVYFNFQDFPAHPVFLNWEKDQILLPIVSKNPNEEKARELLKNKVFLNNSVSGYSVWLESFLEKEFPEKSTFEM